MAQWQPERQDVLDALAAEILALHPAGRVVIAIDGVLGSGASVFAAGLAASLTLSGHLIFRASMNDFRRSHAELTARGADSAEGVYRDGFDYNTFRRILLEPFRLGGSAAFVTAAFDARRDAPITPKWRTGPKDAWLLVHGVFLNRPELAGLWNHTVWLSVPPEVAEQRIIADGGDVARVELARVGQALYFAEVNPLMVASSIIDYSDSEHPRRVFADSC